MSRKPGYQFDFVRSGAEFRVRIADQLEMMDLPVEWAFGAGRQAVTFVTRVNQEWYLEHYSSYYASSRAWGPTPGQESVQAETLPLAAGILYKTTDPNTGIAGCFECHSTGPVSFSSSGEVQLTELGVRCESCHGPGAKHAGAPSRKNINSPARLSAVELNQFCGKCHRPPASSAAAVDWNNAWNVRHQPMYLNESACFRRSKGALSCLTCHDPHEPADQKPASFYNSRCSVCHATSSRASSSFEELAQNGARPALPDRELPFCMAPRAPGLCASTASAARPKSVCLQQTPANCIDCHMPRVSPQTSLRFTNHWIGVYGSGAKLKPIR